MDTGPAQGAGDSKPLATAAPSAVGAPQAVLDLRRWTPDSFHADYVALIDSLGARHGAEKQDGLLDAAELYLAHMLVFEGSSVLEGVTPATPAQSLRHRALRDAATLLNGAAVEDFADSPLNDPGRADRGFWQFLQAIAAADAALLAEGFGQSAAGLGQQSRAVLRAMLPVFAEAAIELGELRHADGAIRTMAKLPGLYESPTGQFVYGRAQEARGNEASALEAYMSAAAGWDKYALRARLAIADMALRSGTRGALLAARDVVAEGRESWRGGQFELELLQRLATLRGALEESEEQLLVLGKLISRFPHTDEALMALMEAERLLSEIYGKGSAGEIPLTDMLELHVRLLSSFRTLPSFPARTEQLADYLAELGATDLAAREYRRSARLLREAETLNPDMTNRALARLNLKLARAQLHAGQAAKARATLEDMAPLTPTQSNEQGRLKADALAELSDWDALAQATASGTSPRQLRQLSKAHAQQGRWELACDALTRFWASHPKAFTVTDASFLLVAANRAGDIATRDKVIRQFPSLSTDDALVQLAASMQAEIPALMPLRIDAAAARLERLEDAFEKIAASQDAVPDESRKEN